MQIPKPFRSARAAESRLIPVVVRAREGKKVVLTGDFSGWSREGVPMKPLGDGRYAAQLKLAPGTYQFRLLVDGEWSDDQDAGSRSPNPFGTENSILEVS